MTDPKILEKFVFEFWREDPDKEDNGIWHDGPKGLRILCRAARSRFVNDKLSERMKVARTNSGNANLTAEKLREINEEVFGEHIVINWENVFGLDGKAIPYSRSAALDMWKQSRRWRNLIDRFASAQDAYANEPEQEKN